MTHKYTTLLDVERPGGTARTGQRSSKRLAGKHGQQVIRLHFRMALCKAMLTGSGIAHISSDGGYLLLICLFLQHASNQSHAHGQQVHTFGHLIYKRDVHPYICRHKLCRERKTRLISWARLSVTLVRSYVFV
jgi:hypothetical protein